ncbi:MAG: malto-oligosyltrehalose trehalohydrolase, partial [Candidatus Omnitrophica bacterium]|nr:malto-oligosyltrehalose trehalohydrolase [Candidatus Omnitrophota bacterium]
MRAVGAQYNMQGSCAFTVWAPFLKSLNLSIVFPLTKELELSLLRDEHGYFHTLVQDVPPGAKYF